MFGRKCKQMEKELGELRDMMYDIKANAPVPCHICGTMVKLSHAQPVRWPGGIVFFQSILEANPKYYCRTCWAESYKKEKKHGAKKGSRREYHGPERRSKV